LIPSDAQPLQPVSDITILSHDPSFYPLTAPKHDNEKNTTTSSTRRMGTCTWLHITLHQGKNRQIRNMFHAIGSGVLFLHRISIGNIHLSDPTAIQYKRARNSRVEYALQPGQWRILTEEEVWKGLGYPSRTIS
jgi:16S rRNA U516 pseudouridylate synthase RsuA-like enzyme